MLVFSHDGADFDEPSQRWLLSRLHASHVFHQMNALSCGVELAR
ncbi:unnamed protein product [Heligmosomoides polygyrus]|uniref:AraC family transcriptional regulator n=1 Tax=Heligmosomoides polygyrus TaxID=6339 RepID=A0A183FAN7_HELPZ|nr:unnamed protein product [Heligmosomoides polygyrus]